MIPTLLTDSIAFDLDRAIHYTLFWGLEAVELRAVGGPRDRVPFVNEQKLKRRLLESELPAVSVVPGMFEGELEDRAGWMNELATLDETLQFCRRLNCGLIVASSFSRPPDISAREAIAEEVLDNTLDDTLDETLDETLDDALDETLDDTLDDTRVEHDPAGAAAEAEIGEMADVLRRAAEKASRTNVFLCVANDHRARIRTGADLARLLDAVDHQAVRAAWVPDEAYRAGEDPARGLDALSDRVGIVRCRSVARIGNGWEPRTIDRGAIDWPDQIARLKDVHFTGPVSLDVRVEPRVKNGLREATELIRMIRNRA